MWNSVTGGVVSGEGIISSPASTTIFLSVCSAVCMEELGIISCLELISSNGVLEGIAVIGMLALSDVCPDGMISLIFCWTLFLMVTGFIYDSIKKSVQQNINEIIPSGQTSDKAN